MEAKMAEKLKQYSCLRASAIDWIYKYAPKSFVEQNAVFHTLLILCTVVIIIAIFATTRRLTLFSLHPVLMTIGTIIFLAEGIASYRNSTLLDFLSPIMQHNKKVKVRAIHQSLQTTGGVFIILGMLFIASHKMELGKSIIPMSVHSLIGTIALLLIFVQAVSGQNKMANLEYGNKRVNRWHGELGLLVWDLLCLTMSVGLVSFLWISLTTVLTLLLLAAVWLCVHAQLLGRPALHKYDSAYDMDGSGENLSAGAQDGSDSAARGLSREDSFGMILDLEAEERLGGEQGAGAGLIGDSDVSAGAGGGGGRSSASAFEKAFSKF